VHASCHFQFVSTCASAHAHVDPCTDVHPCSDTRPSCAPIFELHCARALKAARHLLHTNQSVGNKSLLGMQACRPTREYKTCVRAPVLAFYRTSTHTRTIYTTFNYANMPAYIAHTYMHTHTHTHTQRPCTHMHTPSTKETQKCDTCDQYTYTLIHILPCICMHGMCETKLN